MIQGYLPTSNGPRALEAALSGPDARPASLLTGGSHQVSSSSSPSSGTSPSSSASTASTRDETAAGRSPVIRFYKAWDPWGALGNFSPHAIEMADPPSEVPVSGGSGSDASSEGSRKTKLYRSVEHYYQASKFSQATEEGRKLAQQVRPAVIADICICLHLYFLIQTSLSWRYLLI